MLLKPAFKIDITWRKLGMLAVLGILPFPRALLGLSGRKIPGPVLFCDSVRSGFVALLQALGWEKGAEVIFTFPTITAMPALAEELGYTVVPADCGPDNHPAPVASVRKLVTGKTKALVIAPLFGCRVDLAGYRKLCDEHGMVLIEDAAQGYQGEGWPEKGRAHYTLLSFGLLKRSSCLKGGILLCESQAEKSRCRAVQRDWQTRSRRSLFTYWWLAVFGKICTAGPLLYGLLDAIARRFNGRLSSIFLALARPARNALHATNYMVQPNKLTVAAMRWTLRESSKKAELPVCCRQRTQKAKVAQIGIWPSVALADGLPDLREEVRGYDLVPASVRLASSYTSKKVVSIQRNARNFVEQAYLVDASLFDVRPQFSHRRCP